MQLEGIIYILYLKNGEFNSKRGLAIWTFNQNIIPISTVLHSCLLSFLSVFEYFLFAGKNFSMERQRPILPVLTRDHLQHTEPGI